MAVDLSNYLDDLKREVNPPGTNLFPLATDDELLGHLEDGFWEAYMDGFFGGNSALGLNQYTEANFLVTPVVVSNPDITRDLVQVIIFYAGYRIIRNQLRNIQTKYSASAGPAKIEYEHSANLLVNILKDVLDRRNLLIRRLSDLGVIQTIVLDTLVERDYSLYNNQTFWTR